MLNRPEYNLVKESGRRLFSTGITLMMIFTNNITHYDWNMVMIPAIFMDLNVVCLNLYCSIPTRTLLYVAETLYWPSNTVK